MQHANRVIAARKAQQHIPAVAVAAGGGNDRPAMWVTRSCGRRVVSELSRLGRSPGRIVAILDVLAKAGIAFVAIKENIRIEGKPDSQTRVMTRLFGLFAGVERDLISGRTREGLARAKSSGTKLGAQKGRCASHALTARRQRPVLPMLLSRFRSPRPAARP